MRKLLGRLRELAENADIVLVFLTALVLGVLDLLDVVDDDKASGAILPVLAALAFVWIRDRSRQGRMATQVASVAEDLRTRLAVTDSVRVLSGAAISRELGEARLDTDRWLFKGGTGTYTRAVTLPECFERAERDRRPLEFRLEILDPSDKGLCARYTKLHQDLAPPGSEEREAWTPKGTRIDIYATILACCWYRQRNEQLVDMEVRLTSVITLFRWDMSRSRLIITQRGPQFPALSFPRDSVHYNLWVTELRNSMRQARRLPLENATRLSEAPTPDETRALFAALGIPLPDDFGEREVEEIATNALNHRDPYQGRTPRPQQQGAWAATVPDLT